MGMSSHHEKPGVEPEPGLEQEGERQQTRLDPTLSSGLKVVVESWFQGVGQAATI